MNKIQAGRFTRDGELIENLGNAADIGIDWNVDRFGVSRIECTVNARGQYDAYQRYENAKKGYRLALYENAYHVVSGRIFETEWLPGDRIRYTAYGVPEDMSDSLFINTFASTLTITEAITTILGKVSSWNGDTDDIATNATTLDGWNPSYPQGDYPSEAIPDLLNMSDSSFRLYDLRMIDEPMSATSIGGYKAVYAPRETDADADFVLERKNLTRLSLARSIEPFANIVRVWYGLIQGTSTAVTANTMTDSGATFISDGVAPGDTITNLTKGGRTRVVSVNSETQITHEGWRAKSRGTATGGSTTTLIDTEADFVTDGVQVGDTVKNIVDDVESGVGGVTIVTATQLTHAAMGSGKSNTTGERYEITGVMVSGDDYSISTQAQIKYAEYQIDSGDLWDREIAVFERSMNATQAAQRAQSLATVTPEQRQSFVVGSPFIKDGNGANVSLFSVVAKGGGYVKITDLYPSAAVFTEALNGLTTFFITGMSLDNKTNKWTVNVDTLSRRLDARLQRAAILRTAQIQRY